MLSPKQILNKYWGFTSFRSLQEEVILSILAGKDTLTLMPTGGGKSICYQVPGLMQDGVCLVISPLISLIRDQVLSLQNKGIKTMALTSGMTFSEVDIALDNCIYGNYKFLYLSPEKLQNSMVQNRLKKMKINLIAVDEAHCISEWGYDFRPAYLKIANIRTFIDAPVIGLTATATTDVIDDIQEKLLFAKKCVLRKSILREKLSYVVLNQEDKDGKLLRVLNKVKGSSIVYCATRKETKRVYNLLEEHGISSHYYHGGLDISEREIKQKKWEKNHVRVMVATNAFGMGIDKSNVRLVVHMHLPFSPESYFQEAGRAGRDEKIAYAILLTNHFDSEKLKRQILENNPELEEIRNVYQKLSNYLGLAIGTNIQDEHFKFNIQEFCNKYKLPQLKTYNILKLLEKEGYINLIDAINQPSRIHIKVGNEELYQFQITNAIYDSLLNTILRSYTNVFESFVKIQESIIAKRSGHNTQEVKYYLQRLHNMNLIEYLPQNSSPKIYFTSNRIDAKHLLISREKLAKRKIIEENKATALIAYINNKYQCRSLFLLNYFGEENSARCRICDVCLERNKLELSDSDFEKITELIKEKIKENKLSTDDIILQIVEYQEKKIMNVIQFLFNNGHIKLTSEKKLIWVA